MIYKLYSAEDDARSKAAQLDRSEAYPRKGVHVGSGRHVFIREWDGQGPPPPGWSSYQAGVRKHPVKTEYAVILIQPEQGSVESLPADWESAKVANDPRTTEPITRR